MSTPSNNTTSVTIQSKQTFKPKYSAVQAVVIGTLVNVYAPGREVPFTVEKRVFDMFYQLPELPEAANSHGQPKE